MSGSPAWYNFHAFCSELAARSSSIWVSASYRLAPEHRLPAAIEDCVTTLQWLINSSDPWLTSFADISQIFLSGESAGANLAHHVAMSTIPININIRGLILVHPCFLRDPPTPEELACPIGELINWDNLDACFRLVLPIDCPRSNPFFNPLLTFNDLAAATSSSAFPYAHSTLVAVAELDILHVLGLEYADALRRIGRKVEVFKSHGVGHVFFVAEPASEQTQALLEKIADFIRQHSVAHACKRVLSE